MSSPQRSRVWRCLQGLARFGSTLMFDLKVYGADNVPKDGGVLLLPNHQSYLDPVLVAVKLHRPISYMARASLFEKSRFFAWLIRSLHAFPVKQQTADIGAMRQAIERLQEGHVLNIYPEGTRSRDGEIGPILPGVALVVRRAGVPIVPVAIEGSYDAWPRRLKVFRSHRIRVIYGPPMKVEGLSSQQIIELIDKTLRGMLEDLRQGRVVARPPVAAKSISITPV